MNNKQAFKILKDTPIRAKDNHIEYSKALHTALAALAKQIPNRVLTDKDITTRNFYNLLCPTCKCIVGYINDLSVSCISFCSNCGQALEYELYVFE